MITYIPLEDCTQVAIYRCFPDGSQWLVAILPWPCRVANGILSGRDDGTYCTSEWS